MHNSQLCQHSGENAAKFQATWLHDEPQGALPSLPSLLFSRECEEYKTEAQGERCGLDVKTMERRYHGRPDTHASRILLVFEQATSYSRKSRKCTFIS